MMYLINQVIFPEILVNEQYILNFNPENQSFFVCFFLFSLTVKTSNIAFKHFYCTYLGKLPILPFPCQIYILYLKAYYFKYLVWGSKEE